LMIALLELQSKFRTSGAITPLSHMPLTRTQE